ncbi:MAG: type II toxin-antitoxin system RelE/ParE family toxin [Acidobacteria bacterium]|nr:type II toxin-antitoxin system RelE/ParE family toxin [Acidobacteriota bacterium]HMM80520.1 type II toxin-antitoxin system RelE/ParE family toxin [Pyrinomonadaceae bacterium]
MKVEFNESFLKDLKAVRDKSVLAKVQTVIESSEKADTLDQLINLKKMRGSREYYRIRIGDFRIGLKLDGETLVFIRFLNRKDIYRYFP